MLEIRMWIKELKGELVNMSWENILKTERFRPRYTSSGWNPFNPQKKGREKMPIELFQRRHRLSPEVMKEVRQKIRPLTNLYKQKVPEFEANEESTLWIISKHLTGKQSRNPDADTINTIDEIIKNLTDMINRRR